MSLDNDEIIDLGADFEVIEDLGDDFEVVEESAVGTSKAQLAGDTGAEAQAPANGRAPISSALSWQGFGLVIALCGLLGPWGQASMSALLQGLAIAAALWQLLTHGLGAVQPTALGARPIASALVAFAGAAGMVMNSGELGPILTLVGGLLALAAPKLGAQKDAKLSLPPPRQLDPQFTQSLAVYLAALVGIMMTWGSGGERGVDSIFGVLTLLCVVMAAWASWVGAWKMWTMPVVTGKLGMLLFLAPVEVLLLGLFGVIRFAAGGKDGIIGTVHEAWPADPDVPETFLIHGAGALLTFLAGAMSLVVLIRSAKAAMAMAKDKKAAGIAERKAARAARAK
jgi:hypothetical protein